MEEQKNNKLAVYQVDGHEIKLSISIVRDCILKGDKTKVTNQECVNFITLCKHNGLDPFRNDAYIVKYGTSPAQIIVSKEALMKRAESCSEYIGFEAGIIVQRGEDILEVEGCFHFGNDILLGGWAKVYRKDRRMPVVAKVNIGEYDKGNSIWKEKKSTMIRKVAIMQAMREAFPKQIGGMYTEEEQQVCDVQCQEVNTAVDKTAQDVLDAVEEAMNPKSKNSQAQSQPEPVQYEEVEEEQENYQEEEQNENN